jgi:hypothetical protein
MIGKVVMALIARLLAQARFDEDFDSKNED